MTDVAPVGPVVLVAPVACIVSVNPVGHSTAVAVVELSEVTASKDMGRTELMGRLAAL